MKKTSLYIIIFFLSGIILYAQGGSDYSLFGVGDIFPNVGAYYDGLGSTSIAVPSDRAINVRNPAMWSLVTTTRLQGGYRFNQHIISNNNGTVWQNNGKLDGMLAIFCIDTANGIDIGLGLYPSTSINYMISSPIYASAGDISVTGNSVYQGTGGLTQTYIGLSAKPISSLALGVAVFGAFGSGTSSVNTTMNDDRYYSSYSERKDVYRGVGLKAGLYYSGIENLGIGAFIENYFSLGVNSHIRYSSQLLSDTNFAFSNNNINMPPAYGLGVSYQTGKVIFAADAAFQNFSGFTYQQQSVAQFKNSMQLSAGISRIGTKSRSTGFIDRITYNFGGGYKELYYKVSGQNINEYYGSFGVEVPLVGSAAIDASIQIGRRGTMDNGLLKETFGRMEFDVSLGDVWFKPFTRQ